MTDQQQQQQNAAFASLSRSDVQGLYDHLGTMPFAPGSWSDHWRGALSEALVIDYDVLPNNVDAELEGAYEKVLGGSVQLRDLGYVGTADEVAEGLSVLWKRRSRRVL